MTSEPGEGQIQKFFEDSQGLVEIMAFQQDDFVTLVACARSGDEEAAMLSFVVKETVNYIETRAETADPFLCSGCERQLTDGLYSVVLMVPENAPKSAMGLAICRECATAKDDAKDKGAEGFRRIYPDLRPCVVTHPEGGRA